MLAGRNLRQAVVLAASLDLQERDLGSHLFLDEVEPDKTVEICLHFLEGTRCSGQRRRGYAHVAEALVKTTINSRLTGLLTSLFEAINYSISTGHSP